MWQKTLQVSHVIFANFFWAFILSQSFTQSPFNANLRVCISLDDQDSIECDGDENTRCPLYEYIVTYHYLYHHLYK